MNTFISKALEIAGSQIGVMESGGNNRGPQVSEYLAAVGLEPGEPWCAAFLCWTCEKAAAALGMKNPVLMSGACEVLRAWGEHRDILFQTPQAGDAFLRVGYVAGVYRAHHTGWVQSVDSAGFWSVEGNSNENGSSDGFEVAHNHRTNLAGLVFLRLGLVTGDVPAEETWELTTMIGVPIMPLVCRQGTCLAPARKFGEYLGFAVGWDAGEQAVTYDGKEVPVEITNIGGMGYAPVRQLAEFVGLSVSPNAANKTVDLVKP